MTLPAKRSSGAPRHGSEARARVVLVTGRRHVHHMWSAPRSPAARVVAVPLLLLATLLMVAVGLVVLLTLAAAALVAAAFVLLHAVSGQEGRSSSSRD